MKTAQLLDKLEFHDHHPYAQPLFLDDQGRIIRFMLKAGQSILEHNVPHSPFYVVILRVMSYSRVRMGENSLLDRIRC